MVFFVADLAQTGYACEGSTLTIECGSNRQIHVIRATYGRFNRNICYEQGSDTSQWDLQCFSTKSLRVVEAMYVQLSPTKAHSYVMNSEKYNDFVHVCIACILFEFQQFYRLKLII